MKPATIIKKVLQFQEELDTYYKETENQEVPEVDSTIIGFGGIIRYEVFIHPQLGGGEDRFVTRKETDRDSTLEDTYKIGYYWDEQELIEQIKYDRRRLKKGWRVWKSENPDAELARDDDDE